MKENIQEKEIIEAAVSGDQEALETLLCSVRDMVFNLSLRMLGMIPDAEDATQEILVKVMTHLSSGKAPCRPGFSGSRPTTCGTIGRGCSPRGL